MDWVPVVFIVFKALVFCTGMFFAIKWHYEQGKRMNQRALLRAGGKAVAVFMLMVLGILVLTFGLATTLGLDLALL